ncbi:MAG: cation transporter [Clostridia bacterium]|nr:heavy metal-associated domain-containing protein [Candidatus Pelethousia sp.]NCB31669.1 cation transporter [Clostridia bacterium]
MKKTFKLQDLDCANCAAKMERAICEIEGVESASINFLAQKLSITAPDERLEEIMNEAVRRCKRIEPGCAIVR